MFIKKKITRMFLGLFLLGLNFCNLVSDWCSSSLAPTNWIFKYQVSQEKLHLCARSGYIHAKIIKDKIIKDLTSLGVKNWPLQLIIFFVALLAWWASLVSLLQFLRSLCFGGFLWRPWPSGIILFCSQISNILLILHDMRKKYYVLKMCCLLYAQHYWLFLCTLLPNSHDITTNSRSKNL